MLVLLHSRSLFLSHLLFSSINLVASVFIDQLVLFIPALSPSHRFPAKLDKLVSSVNTALAASPDISPLPQTLRVLVLIHMYSASLAMHSAACDAGL